ncbi:putative methyltransferase-domain-containing protein [Radiomyces spectabilis]|uniref:putative methyltransferase-domain-containing protein n=1 Tax=Radiomyces spectabilis TaxID=64574 RepID=UPI00221FAD52|nr:putative methyltransferase-domain-containing protein [Radiomyces spectabilis]KAI8376139.1 putative methyltransferase-domain-containing protein [Radiomyces spectabilis]
MVATDTKAMPTFTFELGSPLLSLHMKQQNNSQNHGTTVWDSAKVLAWYLADTLKKPTFTVKDNCLQIQSNKTCLELGSGCGLGGLVAAALGLDTVVTDLPNVVDNVLRTNCDENMWHISGWWHDLQQAQHYQASLPQPRLRVEYLDWFRLLESSNNETSTKRYGSWIQSPYNYILAADCVYENELVRPLLMCIWQLASPTTIILIAMERRDDIVVNNFVQHAKSLGFETRMIPKKSLRCKAVGNDDVEIWKLKKKRTDPTV